MAKRERERVREEVETTFEWVGKLDVAASLVMGSREGGRAGRVVMKRRSYYGRAHPDLAIGALQRNISTLLR
jgi:hypothetical protein